MYALTVSVEDPQSSVGVFFAFFFFFVLDSNLLPIFSLIRIRKVSSNSDVGLFMLNCLLILGSSHSKWKENENLSSFGRWQRTAFCRDISFLVEGDS